MKAVDRRGFWVLEASPRLYMEWFAILMIAAVIVRLALAYQAAASSGLSGYAFYSGSFTSTGIASPLGRDDSSLSGTFDSTHTWENADTVYFPPPPIRPDI